ncbi:YaaR family protein [Peptococcaceae bacterium 1198_IL3148]
MKISNINKQSLWTKDTKRVDAKNQKSFSNFMDMANKDHTKQQLKEMLDKIKDLGNKLKQQITPENVMEYKEQIREYLAYVLKNYHKIKRVRSVDYSNLYLRIEIIDQEVEQLTNHFLSEQQDTLEVIAKVDKIAGLLLDIYQ